MTSMWKTKPMMQEGLCRLCFLWSAIFAAIASAWLAQRLECRVWVWVAQMHVPYAAVWCDDFKDLIYADGNRPAILGSVRVKCLPVLD